MYYFNLGEFWNNVAESCKSLAALRYADVVYTYGDLADKSKRLAKFLHDQGCERGDVIAIAHEKKPLSYALMLACLRLGLPYVILDSASPADRLLKILDTARPKLLFYDTEHYGEAIKDLARHAAIPCRLLDDSCLPDIGAAWDQELASLTEKVDGETLAYIMFTSGSTGIPKGVAITHQNIKSFIAWGKNCFSVANTDIFANLSPMYFDNSVFDFYVALFSGASLAPISRQLLQSPYDLVKYVGALGCTLWFSVPSLLIYLMTMKAMSPASLPTLRSISFGGEGYPKSELKKLYNLFSPQATLTNVYGPTECTCICSSHILTEKDFEDLEGLPTLGTLNPGFDYFIDSTADDGTGELILIGPNVGAGYFNDLERTSKSFHILTDGRLFGKHAYYTGDIVREKSGMFYFVGRKDNQIKHMGYRIELEEIESALIRLPGVTQAAAIYKRQNTAFGKIYAFAAYEGVSDEKELLRELAQFLPAYMIPARLALMPVLPKNANGKVDRQALKTMTIA